MRGPYPSRRRREPGLPELGQALVGGRGLGVQAARDAPRAAAPRSPASTARRIAAAIRAGSAARETELASSTPSQPSSIARAASDAVPIPASQITGTEADSTMIRRLYGLRIPAPEPIGEPSGITAAHPACLQPAGEDRVVVGVREHREAVGDQRLGRGQQLRGVGEQGAVVADHLELHPVGLERLAGELRGADRVARRVAAGRVREAEQAEPLDQLDQRTLRRRDRRAAGRR